MMDVDEILKKYSKKIESQINRSNFNLNSTDSSDVSISRDYEQFKKDMIPALSRYERLARGLGSIIRIKPSVKDEVRIQKELNTAHLDITPGEVIGLAFMSFFIFLLTGFLISVSIWFFTEQIPFLFFFLMLIISLFLYYYFSTMPSRLAIKWKLKASSQMVPAILYTVIYMKHTSNLERAINFVSKHIDPPLSLDLKKVLWDVETGKFSNVKDSLDSYLDFWRETNMEFVESFHLIESSLYEPNETRRVEILERALRVILDGVYEKMLKYTHTIKSPLTNVYMLGIVLPTLALALLPLASTLLQGMIQAVHVFVLFNLVIPFLVFYLTTQVTLKRPGGYGETSFLEKNPLYYQYQSKKPYYIAALICIPMFIIGILPLIFGYTNIPEFIGIPRDFSLVDIGLGILGNGNFFGFEETETGYFGPFGFGSIILSLFIPFSIAMFFAISFNLRTKNLIKERDSTKALEEEFNSSLFTLGNRIGDGIPAEIAFAKVADSVRGQKTENFFKIVNSNIQSMGMSLEEAIFNSKRGAIIYFPSSLIATSMRILIESSKKGLQVAAQSLMSISEYVRNIHKINDRLKDLLADVVSDMKSNMTFLAPLLAGIVIGLASMITLIISQLKSFLGTVIDIESSGIGANILNIITLFRLESIIPPYYLQIAIGIYIIEIIFILTITLVIIDSGEDKLKQTYDISKNLIAGGFLYLFTSLLSIILLSILAGIALAGISAG
ncbi:MAG: hypothetical protein QXW97_01865 [Candidatus Pacearchaeota archaeon]